MSIDEAVALLERLERKAKTTMTKRSMITIIEIDQLRRLLSNLRT